MISILACGVALSCGWLAHTVWTLLRQPIKWVMPYEEPPYELSENDVHRFADIRANYAQTARREGDA